MPVGSACMDALDLLPSAGIRYILAMHEQGAGHMAGGYSRSSGGTAPASRRTAPAAMNR